MTRVAAALDHQVGAALRRFVRQSGGVIETGRPCAADQLAVAEAQLSVRLPQSLRILFLRGDGRFRLDGQWWVVWPLDRVVSDSRAAWGDGNLDRRLLAFGDDGTGNPFCVRLDGDEVVRWSWIDGGVERVEGSMDEFVAEWCR